MGRKASMRFASIAREFGSKKRKDPSFLTFDRKFHFLTTKFDKPGFK
jgi:hypothetical protein